MPRDFPPGDGLSSSRVWPLSTEAVALLPPLYQPHCIAAWSAYFVGQYGGALYPRERHPGPAKELRFLELKNPRKGTLPRLAVRPGHLFGPAQDGRAGTYARDESRAVVVYVHGTEFASTKICELFVQFLRLHGVEDESPADFFREVAKGLATDADDDVGGDAAQSDAASPSTPRASAGGVCPATPGGAEVTPLATTEPARADDSSSPASPATVHGAVAAGSRVAIMSARATAFAKEARPVATGDSAAPDARTVPELVAAAWRMWDGPKLRYLEGISLPDPKSEWPELAHYCLCQGCVVCGDAGDVCHFLSGVYAVCGRRPVVRDEWLNWRARCATCIDRGCGARAPETAPPRAYDSSVGARQRGKRREDVYGPSDAPLAENPRHVQRNAELAAAIGGSRGGGNDVDPDAWLTEGLLTSLSRAIPEVAERRADSLWAERKRRLACGSGAMMLPRDVDAGTGAAPPFGDAASATGSRGSRPATPRGAEAGLAPPPDAQRTGGSDAPPASPRASATASPRAPPPSSGAEVRVDGRRCGFRLPPEAYGEGGAHVGFAAALEIEWPVNQFVLVETLGVKIAGASSEAAHQFDARSYVPKDPHGAKGTGGKSALTREAYEYMLTQPGIWEATAHAIQQLFFVLLAPGALDALTGSVTVEQGPPVPPGPRMPTRRWNATCTKYPTPAMGILCNKGKHRSVAVGRLMHAVLADRGMFVYVRHLTADRQVVWSPGFPEATLPDARVVASRDTRAAELRLREQRWFLTCGLDTLLCRVAAAAARLRTPVPECWAQYFESSMYRLRREEAHDHSSYRGCRACVMPSSVFPGVQQLAKLRREREAWEAHLLTVFPPVASPATDTTGAEAAPADTTPAGQAPGGVGAPSVAAPVAARVDWRDTNAGLPAEGRAPGAWGGALGPHAGGNTQEGGADAAPFVRDARPPWAVPQPPAAPPPLAGGWPAGSLAGTEPWAPVGFPAGRLNDGVRPDDRPAPPSRAALPPDARRDAPSRAPRPPAGAEVTARAKREPVFHVPQPRAPQVRWAEASRKWPRHPPETLPVIHSVEPRDVSAAHVADRARTWTREAFRDYRAIRRAGHPNPFEMWSLRFRRPGPVEEEVLALAEFGYVVVQPPEVYGAVATGGEVLRVRSMQLWSAAAPQDVREVIRIIFRDLAVREGRDLSDESTWRPEVRSPEEARRKKNSRFRQGRHKKRRMHQELAAAGAALHADPGKGGKRGRRGASPR